jgi:hypothetical protein
MTPGGRATGRFCGPRLLASKTSDDSWRGRDAERNNGGPGYELASIAVPAIFDCSMLHSNSDEVHWHRKGEKPRGQLSSLR